MAHFDEAHNPISLISGTGIFQHQRFLPIGYAAQPFALVVNNTIYGNDGNASFFPQAPTEPDDTLYTATESMQGRAHHPEVFTASSFIGDTTHFRSEEAKDVDFYKFQLDINDRVMIRVDTNNTVDTLLRVFNSRGEEVSSIMMKRCD